jgi:diguanylate cyclase (GGDEF)-like protein
MLPNQVNQPLVDGPEPTDASKSNGQEGYRLDAGFSQLKDATIMMVDDELITMEVVRTFLEDAGYEKFVLVEDSTKAMESLRAHRPDVLLLDVMMPEIDGFDILGMLRRDPEFSHLPVIILTSSSDASTKLQALDLGATDFLAKPVDPSELALRLRNTLAAKAYQDQLAYYDVLTNLPNRNLFQDRCQWAVQRAHRDAGEVALLYVGFDGFKRVTDTFGPKVGDEVLKQLAEKLTDCLRGQDAGAHFEQHDGAMLDVFRLGSADFAVLLSTMNSIPRAAAIGQRILDVMREPFDAEGTDVYLIPSIGIAGFPEDGNDAASLTRLATAASSQAAVQGGGRLHFYSAEMNKSSLHRLRTEADLRRALDNDELQLLYQPKVDVKSGRILGAEALVRWYRGDGSIVSPVEFIPIAEDTGLILPIGEWVLKEGCAQLGRWRGQGLDLHLSVNISARQFFESDLVGLVSLALAENQLEPKMLTLEITESILIDRTEPGLAILGQLRRLGVRIAIDDFGTGYSSLSYLKRFRVDEVKIDRAFITDIAESKEDRALVYAVTFLAHEFGFRVCAEGIENPGQLDFISQIKCDEYQGFYFSRPIGADTLSELYRSNQS